MPNGRDDVDIESVHGVDDKPMLILNDCVADVPELSANFTVNEYTPGVVGVPLITPDEDKLSPGGSGNETGLTTLHDRLVHEPEKLDESCVVV